MVFSKLMITFSFFAILNASLSHSLLFQFLFPFLVNFILPSNSFFLFLFFLNMIQNDFLRIDVSFRYQIFFLRIIGSTPGICQLGFFFLIIQNRFQKFKLFDVVL